MTSPTSPSAATLKTRCCCLSRWHSPVRTGELCDIAGLSAYKDLNADVIGISVDNPFAQEAWARRRNRYHVGERFEQARPPTMACYSMT